MKSTRWLLIGLAAAIAMTIVGGCAGIQYYAQAVTGHLAVMHAARPIEERLREGELAGPLKAQLERVLVIRAFASRELLLPDNGSYRSYADLGRPYAVWNVIATDEFSIKPKESCFFVVGCVAYRGFYGEANAKAYADTLRGEGLDVFDYGVTAYSTLGWFDDPVLNTFLTLPETELARLIFHELTHQLVYIRDDTIFNESLAVAVEEEGVRRWLATSGKATEAGAFDVSRQRRTRFVALVLDYRERLGQAYESLIDPAGKREAKQRLFARMRAEYERIKHDEWGGFAGYDRWFSRDLNNAHLATVATYGDYVPAFRALIARHDGNLQAFYGAVRELAALPKARRHEALMALVQPKGP